MVENKCKKCGKEIEYFGNELCKACYLKFKEKALKCKSCGKTIDGHNYYWHGQLCDTCDNSV